MSNKRILFMNPGHRTVRRMWSDEAVKTAEFCGFEVDIPAWNGDLPADFDWQPRVAQSDGLLTTWGSPICTRELLGASPRSKALGHAAGSVAAVVSPEVYESGLRVLSANALMAGTVAEWSLLMTLLAQRRLTDYASLRQGETCNWAKRYDFDDIHGITVGVWGFGDISRELLKLLQPLNIGRILVYSSHAGPAELTAYRAERAISLEQLLRQSDVIHCLAGLTPDTFHVLNGEKLSWIKDGGALINCGRALLTDPAALQCELRRGRLRAFLDVFDEEPLPEISPWYGLPNTVMTPHAAAGSGRERYVPYILRGFRDFFDGKEVAGEISRERFNTMTRENCRPNANAISPAG